MCSAFGPALGGLPGAACNAAGAINYAKDCLKNITPCDKKDPDRTKNIVTKCLAALCGLAGAAGSDLCDNPISGGAGQASGAGGAMSSCGVISGVTWVLRQCNIGVGPTGIEIIPPPDDKDCAASGKECCWISKPGRACNTGCALKAESAGQCGCPGG